MPRQLLESILNSQDEVYVKQASQVFQDGYPRFLDEAMSGPRVLVFVEPQHIWIKGKFVAPLESRNDLPNGICSSSSRKPKPAPTSSWHRSPHHSLITNYSLLAVFAWRAFDCLGLRRAMN